MLLHAHCDMANSYSTHTHTCTPTYVHTNAHARTYTRVVVSKSPAHANLRLGACESVCRSCYKPPSAFGSLPLPPPSHPYPPPPLPASNRASGVFCSSQSRWVDHLRSPTPCFSRWLRAATSIACTHPLCIAADCSCGRASVSSIGGSIGRDVAIPVCCLFLGRNHTVIMDRSRTNTHIHTHIHAHTHTQGNHEHIPTYTDTHTQ